MANTNQIQIIELPNRGKAIFKSSAGETFQSKAIKAGTYYKRERAAYLVSFAIGYELVPVTEITEVAGQVGSAQVFIESAQTYNELDYEDRKIFIQDLATLAVFDMLIWQMDRTIDNFLFSRDKVFAIDNGLSFAPGLMCPFLGNNRRDSLIGEKVNCQFKNQLIALSNDSDKLKELLEQLTELIGEDEANACLERIKYVATKLRQFNGSLKKRWLRRVYYNPKCHVPNEHVSFYKV